MNTNTNKISRSLETLYLKEDYQKAIDLLIKSKKNYDSNLFDYNLGTLYQKVGKLGHSRYHLEKSIKNGFINSASHNNLEAVKGKLNVQELSSSERISDNFLSMSAAIPSNMYLTISMLLGLFLILIIFVKKIKLSFLRVLFLIILLISPILYSEYYLSRFKFAVVLKETKAKEGPSKVFTDTVTLREGAKVIIGNKNSDWYFIEAPSSLVGWVYKDYLGIL